MRARLDHLADGNCPATGTKRESLPLIEDMPLLGRGIVRAVQKYWRVARGVRLSVEACVIDEAERTLMVRNENGGTWELPRGIVHKNENLETALRRLLSEVAGIEVNADPELSFFYARSKSEQTGIYLVRHWRQSDASVPRKACFFPPSALPEDVAPKTAGRIRRSLSHRTTSEV
jgi:ADP-ribose pyrophosphatase YjhB (NUDIX family)